MVPRSRFRAAASPRVPHRRKVHGVETPPSSPAHPYRTPLRSSAILAEIDRVSDPFAAEPECPSNAEVLCAGIRAPETVRALVVAELAWVGYQLGARVFAGAAFDPPPFFLLQRVNVVLVIVIVLVASRARRNRRRREEARRERAALLRARAEAVRATILVALCEQRAKESGLLH
jgi:hypothetical protein